ncbi:MAG: DUF1513 domain-containing protein [Myxococcota bacterium]|nr:DUF1513 domain-containing protein [Myxococcota bacterium]
MDRRQFLLAAGAVGLAGAAGLLFRAIPRARGPFDLLSGASDYRQDSRELAVYDFASGRSRLIEVADRVHEAVGDPAHREEALVFTKNYRSLVRVNLPGNEVVASATLPADRFFSGHGVFSADHGVVYVSEVVDDETKAGWITVRDPRSLAVLREFPSHGPFPHQLALHPARGRLLVANGEEPSNLALVDPATGRLEQRLEAPAQHQYRHFALDPDSGEVLLGSRVEKVTAATLHVTAVGVRARADLSSAETFETASRESELLSACFDPGTGLTVLTGPHTGSVQVWDFRRGECLRDYPFRSAAGVVHSDAGFLVSNRGGELLVFGADLPEKPRIIEGTGLAGAHLTLWPRRA